LKRLRDKHIDNKELNALVPSPSETAQEPQNLSPNAVREAQRHVSSCAECSAKVSKYRQLIERAPNLVASEPESKETDCPKESVDWREVAAGWYPELKARQLIIHAALCDHCGPLLRAATFVANNNPISEQETLTIPPPVDRVASRVWFPLGWLTPVLALALIVGILGAIRWSSAPLSGAEFAEIAVTAHKQHTQGRLALDVRSDSQQTLNDWFKTSLKFHLALPASPAVPGEERPYQLEGARLVSVGHTNAAFVAYRMQKGAASLMVTPSSTAVASGGIEVAFKKVSFHYATVEGYKVVTWSVHGLTYALVSDEGNSTQRSCMVCHSPMRDRDLSQTPTPLQSHGNTVEPFLQ